MENRAACGDYMTHLEGLRGIAIILVVLFHLNANFCCNGYVGVDLFLIMSGYLLAMSLEKRGANLRLGDFIKGKVLRLYPPMLACILFVLVIGAWVLAPDAWEKTAAVSVNAITSTVNWWLDAASQGYFAASTQYEPLMHLWYLSVTMQGMIVIAVLHYVTAKVESPRFRKLLGCLFFVATLCGVFLLNWDAYVRVCTHFHVSVDYYIPHTYYWTSCRVAELGLGYWLYVFCKRREASGSSCGFTATAVAWGALLLLLMAAFLHELRNMPILAILCSLVLVSCGSRLGRLLGNRLLCRVGGISFSLYLIHWPIISFWKYATHDEVGAGEACLLAFAAMGMALVLFKCFEKPRATLTGCAAYASACLVLAVAIMALDGAPRLLHPTISFLEERSYVARPYPDGDPLYDATAPLPVVGHMAPMKPNSMLDALRPDPPKFYIIGDGRERPDFVLVGDSHAESLYPGLDVVGRSQGWHGAYMHSYLVPFWGIKHIYPPLPWQMFDASRAESFMAWLLAHPEIKIVMIAQFWKERFFRAAYRTFDGLYVNADNPIESNCRALQETCRRIKQIGKEVVIVTDCPQLKGKHVLDPVAYANWGRMWNKDLDVEAKVIHQADYMQDNMGAIEAFDQMERAGLCHVVHIEGYLFSDGLFDVIKGDRIYMQDTHHFSISGAIEYVGRSAEAFNRCFQKIKEARNDASMMRGRKD